MQLMKQMLESLHQGPCLSLIRQSLAASCKTKSSFIGNKCQGQMSEVPQAELSAVHLPTLPGRKAGLRTELPTPQLHCPVYRDA